MLGMLTLRIICVSRRICIVQQFPTSSGRPQTCFPVKMDSARCRNTMLSSVCLSRMFLLTWQERDETLGRGVLGAVDKSSGRLIWLRFAITCNEIDARLLETRRVVDSAPPPPPPPPLPVVLLHFHSASHSHPKEIYATSWVSKATYSNKLAVVPIAGCIHGPILVQYLPGTPPIG